MIQTCSIPGSLKFIWNFFVSHENTKKNHIYIYTYDSVGNIMRLQLVAPFHGSVMWVFFFVSIDLGKSNSAVFQHFV